MRLTAIARDVIPAGPPEFSSGHVRDRERCVSNRGVLGDWMPGQARHDDGEWFQ